VTWAIQWSDRARHDLRRINRQVVPHIVRMVERLAETGYGDVTRLQGVDPPEWRLRIGDLRVRFQYDYGDRIIRVLRVLPRGRAYRD
jgi:mRNA-degrading endonuclease RelE of RelBE toxin-antitoxin system